MLLGEVVVPGSGAGAGKSILQVIQDASLKLGISKPGAVFGATDRTALELQSVANEAAQRILDEHDWRLLQTRQDFTGDGTTSAYDLPFDYKRMLKDGRLWSSRTFGPLLAVQGEDDWLRLSVRKYTIVIGSWIILGGQMLFNPAIYAAEVVSWYYVSNLIAIAADTTLQSEFINDSDVFRLNSRILQLGIIWEWRQRKGLPYQEDLQTYELALAKAINEDKGARIIGQRTRAEIRAKIAYPGVITP